MSFWRKMLFWRKYKDEISILEFKNHCQSEDIENLKIEINNLNNTLLDKKKYIKNLEFENRNLNRKIRKTPIEEKDLRYFANLGKNEISMGKCDTNALKVFKEFGGIIIFGHAKYSNRIIDNHFWNIIKYIENGEILYQLIDIINHKEGRKEYYSEHIGEKFDVRYIKKNFQIKKEEIRDTINTKIQLKDSKNLIKIVDNRIAIRNFE